MPPIWNTLLREGSYANQARVPLWIVVFRTGMRDFIERENAPLPLEAVIAMLQALAGDNNALPCRSQVESFAGRCEP